MGSKYWSGHTSICHHSTGEYYLLHKMEVTAVCVRFQVGSDINVHFTGSSVNGSQLAKMKKSIPDMSLP